ncbi:hypothetical protein FQN55_001404 [Onygenales sp. PD_40]|nr:hypothetical protein FQN55_001404 [Onygenales sp. PD_40]KAK2790955.1 hypothetical protein FQN51_002416 [Onygenales sp. PD_10]KAK2796048.1 hypothetical protein FQN52_000021 [Onygenales sp. PD_12]
MTATAGPQRPPSPKEKRKRDEEDGTDVRPHGSEKPPSNFTKKPKTIGPTLPPLNVTQDDSSSDSDDDYGPSLPPAGGAAALKDSHSGFDRNENQATSAVLMPEITKRDDWMLKPPEHDDWSSRVDPTKIRNRKFNTGKGATTKPKSGQPGVGTWTETAEEKRKRLEAEVMGIQAPANSAAGLEGGSSEQDAAMAKRVREYNEKQRKTTLYSQHQSSTSKEEEDDPSARPFDKEKDIRGPTKVNHAQRRELLNRSSDFNTRFSGGKFL